MAVTSQNEEPVLLLMPPPADGPTEPRCYGSPAKPMMKREVSRVSTHSSYERLLIEADKQSSSDDAEVEGDCDDEEEGIAVKTNKKSAYMTDEVEEKLQLGGVDPYGLLELEDKRWRASADEIRKSYRRLVLQHHPDKKAALAAQPVEDMCTSAHSHLRKVPCRPPWSVRRLGARPPGPEAPPDQLGSLRWPQDPASGRPKDEDVATLRRRARQRSRPRPASRRPTATAARRARARRRTASSSCSARRGSCWATRTAAAPLTPWTTLTTCASPAVAPGPSRPRASPAGVCVAGPAAGLPQGQELLPHFRRAVREAGQILRAVQPARARH